MVQIGPRRAAQVGTGIALIAGLLSLPSAAATAKPIPDTAGPSAQALAAADSHRSALRAGADDTFTARRATVDPNGARHVRLDRTYKGLPVIGGDVVVHSAPNGQFASADVAQAAPISVATKPGLSAQKATEIASARFTGTRSKATPSLAVDAAHGTAALVWQVVVDGVAPDHGPSHLNVLVDAASGAVRDQWDTVRTFRVRTAKPAGAATTGGVSTQAAATGNGNGYYVGNVTISVNSTTGGFELKDPSRGNGETRDAQNNGDGNNPIPISQSIPFTSSSGTFGDNTLSNRATTAVDAHYGVMSTWDYYKNTYARNGIKNDGVGAVSFVHYGNGFDNAFWDDGCFCMTYGDGSANTPFTSIDVAGHEMSHGVASAEGLGYSSEAAGLNEANSDINGTQVEFFANDPVDTPDYLIGEKLNLNGNGTPLRYMDKPSKDGISPDCYTSGNGSLDPHYSMGPANHFWFMLAVGSGAHTVNGVAYNSPTCSSAPAVTGLGNDKAGKIWYRALATYFTSTETYAKTRVDTIKAANDLYGATECNTVKAAWAAVSVGVQSGEPACAGTGGQAPTVTSPGSQTGKVGTAASLQIQASDPQGDTITYSATGLPAGLSISSSSGLISGTPSTAGTSSVTVTAKDPANNAGTATFTWTINPATGGCTAAQVVGNSGFESGATTWTSTSGVITNSASQAAHGGSYKAWLDGYGSSHTDSLSQSVTVPAGCTTYTLAFWLHIDTAETTGTTAYDKLTVQIGTTTLATYSNLNKATGYAQKTFNLAAYAGQTVTLKFTGVEDASLQTSFVIDDVTLNAS